MPEADLLKLSLDGPSAYVDLAAKDEMNREGSAIPIREDLAADLKKWLDCLAQAATTASEGCIAMSGPAKLPNDAPSAIYNA